MLVQTKDAINILDDGRSIFGKNLGYVCFYPKVLFFSPVAKHKHVCYVLYQFGSYNKLIKYIST
jgi:hypothetical protein